jgi:SAM-dependent methyltransferase
MKNAILPIMQKETYIWGAGHYGVLTALDLENKGIRVKGFIDKNAKTIKMRLGLLVLELDEIENKNSQIIIAVQNEEAIKEIMEILSSHEFKFEILLSPYISSLYFEKRLSEFIGDSGVAPYHIGYLKEIASFVKDKIVLEIGGSNFPRKLLFDTLGVKKWVCVDYLENWAKDREASTMSLEKLLRSSTNTTDFAVFSLENAKSNFDVCDYIKFHGDATYIPESFYEKFDIVVSANAFEHILTLKQVVDKIFYCLAKGGIFFTRFAPIWSCAKGHHYMGGKYNGVLNGYEISFNNIEKDGIPPFIHLLKDEKETREYFADKSLPFGQTQIDCLCEWSYKTNEINRLFYEDYVEIMANSKFKEHEIKPWGMQKINEELLMQLCQRYPKYQSFEVFGIDIFAKK